MTDPCMLIRLLDALYQVAVLTDSPEDWERYWDAVEQVERGIAA